MKTFFDFLYHLVGLMAGAGGLMAFVVGLIVAWDKNHYLGKLCKMLDSSQWPLET